MSKPCFGQGLGGWPTFPALGQWHGAPSSVTVAGAAAVNIPFSSVHRTETNLSRVSQTGVFVKCLIGMGHQTTNCTVQTSERISVQIGKDGGVKPHPTFRFTCYERVRGAPDCQVRR